MYNLVAATFHLCDMVMTLGLNIDYLHSPSSVIRRSLQCFERIGWERRGQEVRKGKGEEKKSPNISAESQQIHEYSLV